MRVMVTGGTGFVGAHSTRALVDAGHEVRLLVRDPDRIRENVEPLGVAVTDYAVGDMTDEGSVGKAMDGCDAVLHCAAVVSLDRRRAAKVVETNPRGAKVVIDAAVDRGVDPIVYTSSASAVFVPGVKRLTADLPPAQVESAYGRSKAAAEAYVRTRQAEGVPITTTYPGGVAGPAAGNAFGEMADGIATHLAMGTIPMRDGGWPLIDVRDVAAIHAAAMQPGRGPRRYMCGGLYMTWYDTAVAYRELTGRRFPVLPIPGAVFRAIGRMVDAISRFVPIDTVFTAESMSAATRMPPTDDSLVTNELGIVLRDPKETLADAIRALHAGGKVSARQAGALALTW
jgi:dihydroflavonol-4-reductase